MIEWFKLKERGAGEKRLAITGFLYKHLGTFPVRIIAFFVAIFVFLSAKERRRASFKFYKIINKKPVFWSSLKQFINYANSLVDKIQSFSGKLNSNLFEVDNPEAFKGSFFITTHVGNIEVLRSLFDIMNVKKVNVFLQANACEMFNKFLKTIETEVNIETFAVEEITPDTSILITEKLQNGEIVFMAGDRISAQNTNTVYEADFLGKTIELPLGTLKFALLTNAPVYFIVCAKDGRKYNVHTRKFLPSEQASKSEKLEQLKSEYVRFLEEYTKKYPYQVYHFYDMFL